MRYRVPESAVDWHITRYNLAHREAQPVEEREARWDAATDEAVSGWPATGSGPATRTTSERTSPTIFRPCRRCCCSGPRP
jgi:hypothetical protein